MANRILAAIASVVMVGCALESDGLTGIGPEAWRAWADGEEFRISEPADVCGWTCIVKEPREGHAWITCGRDDATVRLLVLCTDQERRGQMMLDDCKLELTCSGVGI